MGAEASGEQHPDGDATGTADAVTPAGLRAVLLDVLPLDIVSDTGDQLRSGFGLLHKYQKRKQQAADDAAMTDDLMRRGNARTKARSKFSEGGGVGGAEDVEVEAGEGGAPAAAPPATWDGESAAWRAADEQDERRRSGQTPAAMDPTPPSGTG